MTERVYTFEEVSWAAYECAVQGEGPMDVLSFLNAWDYARNEFFPHDKAGLEYQIQMVNGRVTGNHPLMREAIKMGLERQNLNIDAVQALGYADYRETPVVFANGNTGAQWIEIPRLMEQLCASNLFWTDTRAFLVEFLKIHPFADGNGRTANILYNRRGGEVGGEGWIYDSFDPEQDEWINRAD
jgi:hypothetical protein